MDISRRALVRGTVAAAAAGKSLALSPQAARPEAASGSDFYEQLVDANERVVQRTLQELASGQTHWPNIRRVGTNMEALTAAYCAPESPRHQSSELIGPMEKASGILVAAQHSDGAIDAGNLHSPPDTGFVVQTVCRALWVLRKANDPQLAKAEENLKQFILSAGEALVTGGIHTPNHRWVVSSALAQTHALFPEAKYVHRIEDWLGEGVYIDADGQYSERSTGIYSRVIDEALITLARFLKRPELLEPVRRNLEMNAYYMHPNGEIETIGSRRQDQNMTEFISNYYVEYRYMALNDSNPLFAAMTRFIETAQPERVKAANPLISFLEEPLLRGELPVGNEVPSQYEKLFGNTGMARIRRGGISASFYGGSDWPLGVASGLASNPTFFTYRKGASILQSMRLAADFFSEGAFRSTGIERGAGGYSLQQRFDVPYYQPLPKDKRNPRGDYRLTPVKDARYWSKMDFPDRRMSNIQSLDQRISLREVNGKFELQFKVTGPERAPVTIEIGLRPGGKLDGALTEKTKDRIYLLREGMCRYSVGDDTIEFGPGEAQHEYLNLAGSSYAAHGATLRTEGVCVYITGFTPFEKTLTVS